jgi:hypothetical protein
MSGTTYLMIYRHVPVSAVNETSSYQAFQLIRKFKIFHSVHCIDQSEKYISICSDSQTALETLQAVKTTSSLVRQCQWALDDISTYHSVGLFWVPGHSGIRGNEIADEMAREGSAHHFVGPVPAVGVSRQCIR